MCILRDTTFNQRQKICFLLQPRQLIDFLPFPSACGLTLCVWPGLDGNAARLVLGFSGSSTKFPDGPQPDSHNPRFCKPPLSSRTVGPACADRSPESGWRHSISSEALPIHPETQVLVHIRPSPATSTRSGLYGLISGSTLLEVGTATQSALSGRCFLCSVRCYREPLRPFWVLLSGGDVSHLLERRYPSLFATTGSCASPKPSRCLWFSLDQRVFAGCC